MTATVSLNEEAFRRAISRRRWSIKRAARELDLERSTIYRLFNAETGASAAVIATMCIQLAPRNKRPERFFEQLFTISNGTTPTKEAP